jgi:hypothetical protein
LVKEHAGIDPQNSSREELEKKAIELGENKTRVSILSLGNLLDFIYKKSARKKIINPTFVIHYPASTKPLAVQNKDKTAEMTQLIIAGAEITNQYAELVNPLEQRELLENQAKAKAGGDVEAMEMNNDFITAMEYGMPPMTGNGIGIDRLVGILTEVPNIRDTILFPIMKPIEKVISAKAAEKLYREKKVIVIANEELGYGVTANAIAQLGISIGGFSDEKNIFGVKALPDKDNKIHYPDCFYGMSNLSGNTEQMREFVKKCSDKNIQIFDFSDITRSAHTDQQMLDGYKNKRTNEIEYMAVGAIIPKDFEKDFLDSLKLFGAQ